LLHLMCLPELGDNLRLNVNYMICGQWFGIE